MAKLNMNAGLDMTAWDHHYGDSSFSTIGEHDKEHFVAASDVHTYTVGGDSFAYVDVKGNTVPTEGLVRDLSVTGDSGLEFTLTGAEADLPTVTFFIQSADWTGLEADLFSGHDNESGSKHDDHLLGWDGKDTILGNNGDDIVDGGGGADTLKGGLGGDRLMGGAGADKFAFDNALDSTSVTFDRIGDFDAAEDTFVFNSAVTAIDTAVSAGKLSQKHFDANLANAIDDAELGGHHAVLFTPNDGKHAGETFLIVDLNGNAGYQVGEDAVISFDDTSHLAGLSAANFLIS